MSLIEPYRAAIQAVGRPERELKPIYPQGWTENDQPSAMLVLAGSWEFESGKWPAFALLLARKNYFLGHTMAQSAFPKSLGLPKIFEGSQCLLEVGDEVSIAKDFSTNKTLVVPPAAARNVPHLYLDDAMVAKWDSPCPKTIHPHDVVLTMYAEFVLVLL
jgi:hypothetical protein